MNGLWRALVAGLILAGTAFWLQSTALPVAGAPSMDGISVYAPAASNDNDPCLSDNPRKQKKCNFNGGVPAVSGDPSQNGDLRVAVWTSREKPFLNAPTTVTSTGSGTPLDSVWIWVDGPAGTLGPVVVPCNGATTCVAELSFVPVVGGYGIHGRARDTSGREAQQDVGLFASENSR
jgi:hypothetical protein